MLHLLSIEFGKFKRYNTFWWILGIYAVIIPLVIWGISEFYFGEKGTPLYWEGSSVFKFPVVWNGVTWVASWLNVLLGILVVLMVCNDFSHRTFKQNVIDGLSRKQVITSKFLFITLLAMVVTVYTFILGLIYGLIFSGASDIFSNIYYVGIYFIQTLGYFTLAFLLSILFRKTALSIILFFLIIFLNPLLTGAISAAVQDTIVIQYLPINVISGLTPFPIQWLTDMVQMNSNPDVQAESMQEVSQIQAQYIRTIVAVAYISLFVFISNLILKKRDL